MVKREITCLISDDKRIFKIGAVDSGRMTKSIVLRTTPITNVSTEPLSYVVKMESETKKIHHAVIPQKNVCYLEYVDIETEKEEKPLELHAAASAGEPNGEA
jgi:hypothetical protein